MRLAQKISQELLPFYGDRLIAEFDDIRPTDTEARLAEVRAASPLLSINETACQLLPTATRALGRGRRRHGYKPPSPDPFPHKERRGD